MYTANHLANYNCNLSCAHAHTAANTHANKKSQGDIKQKFGQRENGINKHKSEKIEHLNNGP